MTLPELQKNVLLAARGGGTPLFSWERGNNMVELGGALFAKMNAILNAWLRTFAY